MHPNYLSPKNYTQTQTQSQNTISFYNPQKEIHSNFNTQNYSKSPTNTQFTQPIFQPSSKSYIVKPKYQITKINNNNSGYLKPNLQPQGSTNLNSSPQVYIKTAEMVKSSFHDNGRISQSSSISTNFPIQPKNIPSNPPTRRQPRYSEPAYQSNFESNQDTKASFIPYAKKEVQIRKEQPQAPVHFYKKQKPHSLKENQQKEGKQWLKYSTKLKKNTKNIGFENFEVLKNLGKGKYGQVFLARQKKTGFIVALKMIEKALIIEQQIIDQFVREIKIQMFLNHGNIIKLYGCFQEDKYIYIILEVAMGGQLFQQIKRSQPIPEIKVASIMKQVCAAVDQLHSVRVIHRDIKPQNIVAHEGVYKLCDFGWSVHLDNKMRTTFCGTPLYVCPEILKGNEYNEKIDIWSIGIMMYEMLVGENPFKINRQEQLVKIIKEQISIPSYVYVSRQARDFLDKSLQKNPVDRVTIKELVNHEFFIKNAQKEKNDKKVPL